MDGDISVINGSLVETDKLGEKLDRENYRGREGVEGSWREREEFCILLRVSLRNSCEYVCTIFLLELARNVISIRFIRKP